MRVDNMTAGIRRTTCGAVLVMCLASLVSKSDAAELEVVTTVPDLAWIVSAIGGDRVSVEALCPGYQDPHYLEAKPSYARTLRDADLLVFVGLGLEEAWLPLLLEAARNPNLLPNSSHLLDASASVPDILGLPTGTVDRSQGDVHPFGNPHYLLDPRNTLPIGITIADALTLLDPDGGPAYAERLGVFLEQMEEAIALWSKRALALEGLPVTAYHQQWEYLARWLAVEIVAYVENRPGVPPSPRHVDGLIRLMKQKEVNYLLVAPFVDVAAAKEVAKRSGAEAVVLPAAVGGVEGAESLQEMFDLIVTRLLGVE